MNIPVDHGPMAFGALAALLAFTVSAFACKMLIPMLTRLKFGQQVREHGPKHHLKKSGTPTMGGLSILLGFLFSCSVVTFFVVPSSGESRALAVMLATCGFGVIGFLDDYIKIRKKRSLGLRAYQKILGQLVVSAGFVLYWQHLPGSQTEVVIPFLPIGPWIDIGPFLPVFACLVFLSSTNGSNLTDGLDGLNTGVTAIIAAFFLAVSWLWLQFDMIVATGAMIGALLGFLLFNSYPGKIIMGDTGSLALGGFVAAVSLVLGMSFFLLIVAIIYVIESLSVIIQVGYFKLTGGKRFFKMAPIHHTFELIGWPETKIVSLFLTITALAALVGLSAL